MKRLKRISSVVAVAAFALSMMVLPAQAATTPGTATCTGTAKVTPGLYFPGVGPSQDFAWELHTTCTVVSSDGVETLALDASGTATGYCGRSTGAGGSGSLGDIALSGIGWESVGSVLIVSGSHDGGGAGTFVAEVDAIGGQPCATTGATDFEVVVEAEFV